MTPMCTVDNRQNPGAGQRYVLRPRIFSDLLGSSAVRCVEIKTQSRVQWSVGVTKSKIEGMTDDELKGLFDALRQENAAARQENAAARQENAAARQENAAAHEQTRRQFDVTVERIEKRFDLLAETAQHIEEELRRTGARLDEKIERSAAETQAMIKFSHKELDRRVTTLEDGQRSLEETVADLQARLQRIESGTH